MGNQAGSNPNGSILNPGYTSSQPGLMGTISNALGGYGNQVAYQYGFKKPVQTADGSLSWNPYDDKNIKVARATAPDSQGSNVTPLSQNPESTASNEATGGIRPEIESQFYGINSPDTSLNGAPTGITEMTPAIKGNSALDNYKRMSQAKAEDFTNPALDYAKYATNPKSSTGMDPITKFINAAGKIAQGIQAARVSNQGNLGQKSYNSNPNQFSKYNTVIDPVKLSDLLGQTNETFAQNEPNLRKDYINLAYMGGNKNSIATK